MNALFVDAVTKAKSQVTGSIPADRAVARVNALDWQEIGDNLDQQGSALIQHVLSATNARLSPHCTLKNLYSAAASSWDVTASDAVSINISTIHYRILFRVFVRCSSPDSRLLRIAGTRL